MARLLSGPVIAAWIIQGQVRNAPLQIEFFFLHFFDRISPSFRIPSSFFLSNAAQWPLAVPSLIVSGVTDWLDGYYARKAGGFNVLGSYLDPLADKVLVGCVVGALGYTVRYNHICASKI